MSPGVKADPADPVVDGRVMPVRPIHLQGVPVGHSGRMVRAWLFLSYPKWVLGVEVEHPVVLDVDLRNPVVGGGE